MKIPFSKKITTKLLFLPLLFLLVLFAAFAGGFYFLSPQNPFEDFHRQHLMNLLAEKKLAVDMWSEQAKKGVEYLAKSDILREEISVNNAVASSDYKRRKRAIDTARAAADAASLRLLDDMVIYTPCKMFALLSKDGKIISSSQRELIGSNWSDRDFFAGAIAELRSPSVRVFYSINSGMVFLSPVFDDKENLLGIIYAIPNNDKLARLLRVENAVYKTEKVEMLDKEGNLILTQKGFPDKRMKYNVPKESIGNSSVHLKDNLFFYVVSLENTPFRLIATIEKAEVTQPLIIVSILCAAFAGLLLIVLLFQMAWSGPKLISKPVARFVNAAKAVTDGIFNNINLGKDYGGELAELKKAFESMVDELKTRESIVAEKLKSAAKATAVTVPSDGISDELRDALGAIVSKAEGVIRSDRQLNEQSKKAFYDILCSSKDLLLRVDNHYDYAQLTQEKLVSYSESFSLCELLNEIESYAKDLVGMKEIELVVDCQEVFMNNMVYTDRSLLKKVLLNLVSNAVTNTLAGTITMLTTERLKDDVECIEVSVADTGRGFSNEELDQLFGDISYPHSSVGLIMARKIAELIGGSLEFESLAGKGSVFTVIIPFKAIAG